MTKASKNKKKNRRRKDQEKNALLNEPMEPDGMETNGLNYVGHDFEHGTDCQASPSESSKLQDVEEDILARKVEFDDGDMDDEIDPALKEKIDREVEDFARRLKIDWPERMQEILSLGQERRPVPSSLNGSSSLRK